MLRIHKALACLAISTAVWLAILGRPEVVGGARTAVLLVREGEKGGERGSPAREVAAAPRGGRKAVAPSSPTLRPLITAT